MRRQQWQRKAYRVQKDSCKEKIVRKTKPPSVKWERASEWAATVRRYWEGLFWKGLTSFFSWAFDKHFMTTLAASKYQTQWEFVWLETDLVWILFCEKQKAVAWSETGHVCLFNSNLRRKTERKRQEHQSETCSDLSESNNSVWRRCCSVSANRKALDHIAVPSVKRFFSPSKSKMLQSLWQIKSTLILWASGPVLWSSYATWAQTGLIENKIQFLSIKMQGKGSSMW